MFTRPALASLSYLTHIGVRLPNRLCRNRLPTDELRRTHLHTAVDGAGDGDQVGTEDGGLRNVSDAPKAVVTADLPLRNWYYGEQGGEEVYCQRKSDNPTCVVRVVRYALQTAEPSSKHYPLLEYQVVYDGGDGLCADTDVVLTKALQAHEVYDTHTCLLTSTATMLCGLSFCKNIPTTVLTVGNSGNCVINYIVQRAREAGTGVVVEVVDACSASQYANDEYMELDAECEVVRPLCVEKRQTKAVGAQQLLQLYHHHITFDAFWEGVTERHPSEGRLPPLQHTHTRTYDIIFQDADVQPNFQTQQHLQRVYDLLDSTYGVFVARLYCGNRLQDGITAKDFGSPGSFVTVCGDVFEHVYVSLPESSPETAELEDPFMIVVGVRSSESTAPQGPVAPSL
uniref:E3 ubiquitin-protein ligase listerin n=2 Tax=Lygus hesperus TaxID=30085 RepID=A0A0A9Y4T8_LYGHE